LRCDCWGGAEVLTLGTEAFFWFAYYCLPGKAMEFWAQEDRYERVIDCVIRWQVGDQTKERRIEVAPLPHPSPLNRKWQAAFPELLAKRLRR